MKKRSKRTKYKRKFHNTILKLKKQPLIKLLFKRYIFLILIFVTILSVILKYTFFNPNYQIQQVTFNKKNFSLYYNQDLYDQIVKYFSWKNIYIANLKKWNILEQIQSKYPIVKNIKLIRDKQKQKVIIDITFNYPKIIFKTEDWLILWSLNNKLFELNSKSLLITWTIIFLPEYITSNQSFSGFYFKIDENKLHYQFKQLINYFGNQIDKIIYLPWWGKIITKLKNGKEIYFDSYKDILLQINKLEQKKDILTNPNIEKIDVGSLKDFIFIKTK